MKQKDLLLIVVIGIVSAILSIVVSKIFLVSDEDRKQQVEVVKPISAEFVRPSKQYFNEQSVNPTQIIQIGIDKNDKPFDGTN